MMMSTAEALWRVRRIGRQTAAKVMRGVQARRYVPRNSNSASFLEAFEKIQFYGLLDMKPSDVPISWQKNTIAAADKLLQHKIKLFALDDVYLGRQINWNHEYKRNIDTPIKFSPWMDYRDTNSYGDFKYFWELARLQHLIPLAKAYYLTADARYAREVADELGSFVRQCPYLLGIHWVMPMEAAIRLVSLSWVTAFLREYLREDNRTCGLIECIIRSHSDYVMQNLSRFSSANNHLVTEVAGVFIASTCFPFMPKAEIYRKETYKILCYEITNQFYADGVNKEQATHYHIACYNCFLLASLLSRANGLDFPLEYWQTLENAASFVCAMATDDNYLSNIGDSDDGRTVVLSEAGNNQVQSLLVTAAVLFDRDDFKAKAKDFDETSFWLLGRSGIEKFKSLSGSADRRNQPVRFDKGGYYIFEATQPVPFKLIFDSGPLGFGSIAAHGHADALSFILYVNRLEFFIDPGTYTYIAKDPFRNYFRSTAAHNTIVVDGFDQSEMAGPFLWTKKAQSSVEEFVTNEHYYRIVASHNGYRRLPDPVIHCRAIDINKKLATITIEDRIEAQNRHTVAQYFHFSPDCEIQMVSSNRWRVINGDTAIQLTLDRRLDCKVLKGSDDPTSGWSSKSYDQKLPSLTLFCTYAAEPDDCLRTTIRLQD